VNLTGVLTPTVTIDDGVGVGTIVDDDATNPASVSIGDTTLYEGNSGMQNAVFSVRLTAPVVTDTVIPYSTTDGSAVAPGDYKAKTGTATIKAGKTSAKISISTYGNLVAEGSRQFYVHLGSTTVPVLDSTGSATIVDDDAAAPGVSIGDAVVTEGDTGTVVATHVVTLSSPAAADIGITYVMSGAGATAGLDFKAKTGTLKIKAGKSSGKISVTVNGDTLDESDEVIEVSLTGTGASGVAIVDDVGTATVLDDDTDDPEPEFTWGTTAGGYGGGPGSQVSFTCPAGGEPFPVWGTDIYTDDSSICTAAVHKGLITFAAGGNVTIEILGGQGSYTGSVQNGVTSNSWGSWGRSFQFFVEIPI
jgi:chitinase